MQIALQKRETTDGTLATGLLLGLWIGEVLATAEYWLLRVGSFGLRAFGWLLRRPVFVASSFALACIGFLGADVFVQVNDARMRTAVLEVKAISNGAGLYRVESGHWPSTLEQLVPRHLKELHADPWGRNYVLYRGEGGIAVVSAGPDRELGSPDDVFNVIPKR